MHERPYTEQIVQALVEALKDQKEYEGGTARVKVGEIYHLVPDSVRTHFLQLTAGTPLEKVALDLEEVPLKVQCHACGAEGGVEDHHFPTCKACGSASVKVVEGDKIVLDSVTLSIPDAPGHSHK